MQEQMNEILTNVENKMQKSSIEMLKELSSIRTDISNPNVLDKININYYGENISLKQLSSISVVEGNQLNIKPYDIKITDQIKKAILASDLGINPEVVNNSLIKLIFPPLTEERRKSLIKQVEKISENVKVVIRNIRREGNNKIKTMILTKDLELLFLKKNQILTDKYIELIEKQTNDKKKELLKI
ncbi:Ribosome recycling factor [Candidatus Phytoplasma mali]|uniref:Ribosome recycling factor n=1 Tax=Phytoplasma mali (strain AT) TaxID=482235 RepID=B3QZN5_PHYMT|nr:ribosome-recycling factor [Candidatus Phytoplasma mali]CAP18422.1 Ribosome recycling factor [Candidatus Phytoplasma mali]